MAAPGAAIVSRFQFRAIRSYRLAFAVLASNAVALGFARFTYDALLPQMRDGLQTSSTVMALIASTNMAGYIVGSAASAVLVRRFRPDSVALIGLLACTGTFAFYSIAQSAAAIMAVAFVPGAGGALALICGTTILGRTVSRHRRGMAFGIATAGIGVGSSLGAGIAYAVDSFGAGGWRVAWLVLAVLTAAIILAVRRPFASAAIAAEPHVQVASRSPEPKRRLPRRGWIFPVYMCWGLAMVLYSTFFTTFLNDERGVRSAHGAAIFSLVGLCTILGGLAVGPMSDRFGRRRMLAFTLLAAGLAIGLVLFGRNSAAYIVSALLFGLPISGIGTLVMAFISDSWPIHQAGSVFGRATVAFGISIVTGPMIAAIIVTTLGSFRAAFVLALVSVTLGALGVSRLPARSDTHKGELYYEPPH